MDFEKVDVHEKALSLPSKPGVYLMLDKNREVIYVGKAKKLINRVSSYFRLNPNHNYKTQLMVKQVWDFDYIVTDTEFDALLLENSLIKRHMPKYNILLKDDKGYPFICLDMEKEYPTFSIVYKRESGNKLYFGPYGGRSYSKKAIDEVCQALMLPTCSRKFPRDIGKTRPCLNYHLGKCSAVCAGKVGKDEYMQLIEKAKLLLEGETDLICTQLQSEMEKHAEKLEFEAAARIRDKIKTIKTLCTRQKVLSGRMSDTDIIAVYAGASKTAFAVLNYIDGALVEKNVHIIETPVYTDRAELMSEFLRYYYMPRKVFPKNIWVSDLPEDAEALKQWMSTEINGKRVNIQAPQRGEKAKLVEMALENARESIRLNEDKEEIKNRTLDDLKKLLALKKIPERIEAYDISNTAGKEIVGSMVVYKNGVPYKKAYRRFKIETLSDQDDCAAMREMLTRRLERMLSGDEKFLPAPELILIDGGIGQTKAVEKVAEKLGVSVPVFGMVKDDRHRTRAIVNSKGEELWIRQNPAVFRLIGGIQEEVHRFAIEYHRKLRDSAMTASTLNKIQGVGAKRASLLLREFKSISKIKNLSIDELERVVPKNIAENIYRYYREEK